MVKQVSCLVNPGPCYPLRSIHVSLNALYPNDQSQRSSVLRTVCVHINVCLVPAWIAFYEAPLPVLMYLDYVYGHRGVPNLKICGQINALEWNI